MSFLLSTLKKEKEDFHPGGGTAVFGTFDTSQSRSLPSAPSDSASLEVGPSGSASMPSAEEFLRPEREDPSASTRFGNGYDPHLGLVLKDMRMAQIRSGASRGLIMGAKDSEYSEMTDEEREQSRAMFGAAIAPHSLPFQMPRRDRPVGIARLSLKALQSAIEDQSDYLPENEGGPAEWQSEMAKRILSRSTRSSSARKSVSLRPVMKTPEQVLREEELHDELEKIPSTQTGKPFDPTGDEDARTERILASVSVSAKEKFDAQKAKREASRMSFRTFERSD